jgi:beta-N-acetylhexosaminidase
MSQTDSSDVKTAVGQLFMCGMPGTGLDDETKTFIREEHPGGFILFARNVEGPMQVAKLCRDLQDCATHHYGIPLFLAVDQEGGRVARLREPFTSFPGNAAIGASDQPLVKAREFGRVTAFEMGLVGLNMNLAPVVDVRRGEIEKHLDGRSFGEDPEKVSLLGKAVIDSLQENGIMAVAKHFPGLGRATLDPHVHLPRIEIGRGEIQSINLAPFRAAVASGVSGIMTSHAVYPALDPDLPATLSSTILSNLLREEMGFAGLILTDDLEMGAIVTQCGVAEGAARAFRAGADLLLICKQQSLAKEAMDMVRERVRTGSIPSGRLEDSLERIRTAKNAFLSHAGSPSFEKIREYFGA